MSIEDPCCGADTGLCPIPLGIYVFGCVCASAVRACRDVESRRETVTVRVRVASGHPVEINRCPLTHHPVTANHTQGPVCVIMVNDRD